MENNLLSEKKVQLENQELEAAIVGALINSYDVKEILTKIPYLKAEYFAFNENASLFDYITTISEGGVSILKLTQQFPDFKDYILSLNNYNNITSIRENVNLLIDFYKRRQLRELSDKIADSYNNLSQPIAESILEINANFENVFKKNYNLDIVNSKDVSKAIYEDLFKTNTIQPTGIKILDEAMGGGLYKGKAYAIAARKKTGKTIIASTISNNLNFDGTKHLFIAAEMSPIEIHQRNISRNIGKNSLAFIGSEKHNENFQKQVNNYKDPGNIFYLKSPGIAFKELKMSLSTAVLKHKIDGFILDYFQLVSGKGSQDSLVNHYDEIAQWIATFCRDNNVWALVMAQMNQDDNIRGGEGIRLAFDQVYELKKSDYDKNYYMEQMDTRYTPWCSMGSTDKPSLLLDVNGPYFKDTLI